MGLFKQSRYLSKEIRADRMLREAMVSARNRHLIRRGDRQLLDASHGHHLLACNRHSRTAFFRTLCAELERHFDLGKSYSNPNQALFLLTVVDIGCCVGHDTSSVDIRAIRKKLRVQFPKLSYVGCIDAAIYVNKAVGSYMDRTPLVSFHLHAIAWGVSDRWMRKRVDEANASGRYRAIADGLSGIHCTPISRSLLPTKLAYANKTPRKEYRLGKLRKIGRAGTPMFLQTSAWIRPGNQIKLFRLCRDFYLDELLMARGEGVPILKRAKERTLRHFDKRRKCLRNRHRSCRKKGRASGVGFDQR